MDPVVTVVLVAANYRARAQRALRSVLAQDIADQIAILFYDRADKPARDFPELNHPSVKYEAVDKNVTLGELQKRGILAATSEIVGLIEEHVAVPPNWLRESLRLHAKGYAGVTGVFLPGNEDHRISKLSFLITYGSYILPQTSGETNHIPADNSTLVRSKVLRYKDDLALLLDTDTLLIRCMVADGEKVYASANIQMRHWNEAGFLDACIALIYWNQAYIRTCIILERWSPLRQIARLLTSPLIAFVRSAKSYAQARRNRADMKQFFVDLPAIFALHMASGIGIAAGLLFGYRNSRLQFTECETNIARVE
jgi:glycosyltransferase involved in cell wall biosynthesis